jgi:alanine racemase
MNRLGFECSEADRIRKFLGAHSNFQLSGICTHFLNGDDLWSEDGFSKRQFEKISEISKKFENYPHQLHALNSSALLSSAQDFAKLGVRPGVSLYGGIAPTRELDFRPVMSVKSELVLFHEVKAGETVSYGANFKTQRDSLIGVVPFGYADGYFRQLGNQSEVLCHGHLVPVVGTVCMDYLMLDLTELKSLQNLKIGDEVVLFGSQRNKQILASDLAKKVGTISYEVFTRVSERVPRVFIR